MPRIIASGIIPVAIEFMDRPAIEVCEAFAKAGYPLDVEALLIVEVEGSEEEIADRLAYIVEIAKELKPKVVDREHLTRAERQDLEGPQGGLRRHRPHLRLLLHGRHDPAVAAPVGARADRQDLRALRPQGRQRVPRRRRQPASADPVRRQRRGGSGRAEQAGAEILKLCVAVGGCLTGEHGVGIEKRDLMRVQFTDADLALQMRIKSVFDPHWLLNRGKVFPLDAAAEVSARTPPPIPARRGRGRLRRPDVSDILRPAADWELQSMIAALVERQIPVEIVGSGSKRAIGRPMSAPCDHDDGLRGITLYEPTELVMSARAGTPVSQIEAELATRGQMLPFEPIDHRPGARRPAGLQTIGAVFATNLSGSRRITAARRAIICSASRASTAAADLFKSGGRVMKNVTGYDVARGLTGSWGTLAVLTEVTFKVVPLAGDVATVVYLGLPDDLAVELMCAAMAHPVEVSGTVHLQAPLARRLTHPALRTERKSVTALRIENFTQLGALPQGAAEGGARRSTGSRWSSTSRIAGVLGRAAAPSVMVPARIASVAHLDHADEGAEARRAIKRYMPVEAFYDWAGGLVWLEVPDCADAGTAEIRRAVAIHGGHATLIRAEPPCARGRGVPAAGAGVETLTRGL